VNQAAGTVKHKPLVAVSACLLGHAVRYDGKDKYTRLIAEELQKYCRLVAVCPELEVGLGVPRPKIQLTQVKQTVRVLREDNAEIDLTEPLVSFAIQFSKQYDLAGLVLQDKSPSCGLGNTKVYSQQGKVIAKGDGVFSATLLDILPSLLIVQASQLQNKNDIFSFVKAITLKQQALKVDEQRKNSHSNGSVATYRY